MELKDLPTDVMLLLMEKIPLHTCNVLNKILKINIDDMTIYENFVSNNKMFQDSIKLHFLTATEFYKITKNSGFNIKTIMYVIHMIGNDLINNTNKYNLNLNYSIKYDNDIIDNSLLCIKVLLTMIHGYVIGEFKINNPYYYLHTTISNMIFNYTTYIIQNKFGIHSIAHNITSFKLMMLQSKWYLTNKNLYNILILYLIRTKIIQNEIVKLQISQYLETIDMLVNEYNTNKIDCDALTLLFYFK